MSLPRKRTPAVRIDWAERALRRLGNVANEQVLPISNSNYQW